MLFECLSETACREHSQPTDGLAPMTYTFPAQAADVPVKSVHGVSG